MSPLQIQSAEDFIKKVRTSGKSIDARKQGYVVTMEEREGSHLLRMINIHPGKDTLDCCLKDLAAIAQEFAVPFSVDGKSPSPEGVACVPAFTPSEVVKFVTRDGDGNVSSEETGEFQYYGQKRQLLRALNGPDWTIEAVAISPSPAEPVKVLGGEPEDVDALGKLSVGGRIVSTVAIVSIRNSHGVVAKEVYEPHAHEIVTACSSHAAHLAKIQALSERLQEAADTIQSLAKRMPFGVTMDVSEVHDRCVKELSLPSA